MKNAACFAIALLCAATVFAQSREVAAGQKLFESQCAVCHGQNGTGGRGPALNQPKLSRAPDDSALAAVIAQGLGTEMPGAWQLSPREVTNVVKYVRSLGAQPQVPLPGDPARGAALYRANACAACHIIQGSGGGFGPELSAIGARRNAAHLRQSLTDPGAFVPAEYTTAEATTLAGKTILGLRANEDTFTLQIKTIDGRFHSFRRSELKSAKPKLQSLMPAYGTLTAAQLDDIVSYLASLRGTK